MTEIPEIPQLRHRAWVVYNTMVKNINAINATLYEGKEKKPPNVLSRHIHENHSDISIDYIKLLIDDAKELQEYLKNCNDKLNYIYKKHEELKNTIKNL